jgi:hypothetical protein
MNSSGSALVCDRPVYDFGTMMQGEEFAGEFKIENHGDADVMVTNILHHCSCMTAALSANSIPAHTTATLKFSFRTRSFDGDVSKAIEVQTKQGPNPGLVLTIRGRVQARWGVDSPLVDLGALRPGQVVEKTFQSFVRDGFALKLRYHSPSPDVTLETVPEVGAAGRWRVRATLRVPPGATIGHFARQVTIYCDQDEMKPSALVNFMGRIEGDLRVEPRLVAFGRIPNDREARKTLTIASRGGTPFKILEIKTDATILVEGERDVAKPQHELVVVFQKGLPAQLYRSLLVIVTDHAEEPRFSVSTLALVERP